MHAQASVAMTTHMYVFGIALANHSVQQWQVNFLEGCSRIQTDTFAGFRFYMQL